MIAGGTSATDLFIHIIHALFNKYQLNSAHVHCFVDIVDVVAVVLRGSIQFYRANYSYMIRKKVNAQNIFHAFSETQVNNFWQTK